MGGHVGVRRRSRGRPGHRVALGCPRARVPRRDRPARHTVLISQAADELPPDRRGALGRGVVLPGARARRTRQACRHGDRWRDPRRRVQADRGQAPVPARDRGDRRRVAGGDGDGDRRHRASAGPCPDRGRVRGREGAAAVRGRRDLPVAEAARPGRGRGADGLRLRALRDVRGAGRVQGRLDVGTRSGLCRRAGVQPRTRGVGSLARRRRVGRGALVTARTRSIGVDLAGVALATPVLIASGCAGAGKELHGLVELRRVGGIVSRTITVEPREGSAPPRIVESPAGVVWDTGLQNPGVDAFVDAELPSLASVSQAVVVSIAGATLEEYVRVTGVLQGRAGVAGIEVHLSGPDRELERPVLGAHADRVTEVVGAVARMSLVPVFAKLPGGVDVVPLAVSAARAGASGLTLCASPPALAIDRIGTQPALGAAAGWLSGPALKPMTLRAVAEVHRALPRMPLVASGGIRTADDAVEAMLAGASAVQVGTATLVDPAAPVAIAKGIVAELQRRAIGSPAELRGAVAIGTTTPEQEEQRA